jgi:hypothetical protein
LKDPQHYDEHAAVAAIPLFGAVPADRGQGLAALRSKQFLDCVPELAKLSVRRAAHADAPRMKSIAVSIQCLSAHIRITKASNRLINPPTIKAPPARGSLGAAALPFRHKDEFVWQTFAGDCDAGSERQQFTT